MRKHTVTLDIAKVEQVIAEKGLRKKWIADKLAVHPNTFYDYLRGARTPSQTVIRLLAVVLGLDEGDIAA